MEFVRLIRIFLIIAWISVGLRVIILLSNMFLGRENTGGFLRLFVWLVAAIAVTIYLRKKKTDSNESDE